MKNLNFNLKRNNVYTVPCQEKYTGLYIKLEVFKEVGVQNLETRYYFAG